MLALAACASPPDLVLVTLDTTRRDAIGAYGGPPTPTLDALAAEGIRFDRATTVAPLTLPAHASLLTGRWPTSTGVRDNGDAVLAASEHSLAERLAAAGYDTGAAVGARLLGADWGFAQGFDWYDAPRTLERPAAAVVDAALGWLAARPEGPIFLWVHLYDPHSPHPEVPGDPYLAEVAEADAQLGRLFAALRARPGWARTGVVVLADHGEGRGDHGEREHGALVFASTTAVPLILRPPGGGAPGVDPDPVSIVDVMPTLLGWAGLEAEGMDGQPLDAPPRPVFVESHQLARHLGWAPLEGLVDAEGAWTRSSVLYHHDREDRLIATGGEAPAALEAHYAAPAPAGSAPGLDQLAALQGLGYLAGGTGRRAEVDPIAGIAGFEALREAARSLAAEDLAGAAAAIAVAKAVDPAGPALRLLEVALRARTDLAGALAEAEALYREAPSPRVRATLGELLLRAGRPTEALPHLKAANAELPPDARGMGLYGLALAASGEAQAADLLERALSADPTQPLLRGARGRLLLRAGDPAGAIPWLEEEIARHPPASDARKALVEARLAAGHWREALAAVEALEAARPPDAGSAFARAVALHRLGDEAGAAKALARCLRSRPPPEPCRAAARGIW